MSALIRLELRKALRNKWFAVALGIGVALALASALLILVPYLQGLQVPMKEGLYISPSIQSSFCFWMNVELQTPTSPLFYRLAPLLAVIPFAWSLQAEMRSGYINQLYTKVPRGKYLCAKGCATFIAGGLIGAVPQIVNFAVLAAFVPGRLPNILDSLYIGMGSDNLWAWAFFNLPLLFVALYCALGFVLCGLWALFVLSLSSLTRNRVVLLAAPYLALLIVQFANERVFVSLLGGIRGIQLSLFENLHAMSQPYFSDGRIIAVEALVLLLAALALFALRRKRDVL